MWSTSRGDRQWPRQRSAWHVNKYQALLGGGCLLVLSESALAEPIQRYVDPTPMPALTQHQQEAGYVVFAVNYLSMVFPATIPRAEQIDQPVAIAATPGEYEPIVLAVRSLRPLGRLNVSVSELRGEAGTIPASAIEIQFVEMRRREGKEDWAPWYHLPMLGPYRLIPEAPASVKPDATTQVWMTVLIPETAKAGSYTGQVRVQPEGAASTTVPITVQVWPFELAQPDGLMFMVPFRYQRSPEASTRQQAGQPANYTDRYFTLMRDHGMTSVWLMHQLDSPLKMVEGTPRIRWNGTGNLETSLDAYARAGFSEPVVWAVTGKTNTIGDIAEWCLQFGDFDSDAFASCHVGVVREILAEAKRRGWPDVVFQWSNEPQTHAKAPNVLAHAKAVYRIMHQAMPELKTAINAAGQPRLGIIDEVYPYTDFFAFHDGPFVKRGQSDPKAWQTRIAQLQRDGKGAWFYNPDLTEQHPEVMRFIYGVGLWTTRPASGVRMNLLKSTDGQTPDRPIDLEGAREGIDDYRYLLTFEQWVQRARASGDSDAVSVADHAERELDGYLERITFEHFAAEAIKGEWLGEKRLLPSGDREVSGPYKVRNGWEFTTYDEVRRLLASWIIRLQRAVQQESG